MVLKKVFSFSDCEKDYDQFLKDVSRAEVDLLSKGITFSKDYKKISKN
jgi:polyphosphate kinase 2 (PPK2 family)